MSTMQKNSQKFYDEMTQIQAELEALLHNIFERSGHRIQPEIQAEIREDISDTKQVLERYKAKYVEFA